MTLGQNITSLRKRLKFSQNDLGKKVGTSGDIIGRYERDEVKPSIDVAIKIADALNVSLDFLVGKTSLEVDRNTLKRLEEISTLSTKNKEIVFTLLDSFLATQKLQDMLSK